MILNSIFLAVPFSIMGFYVMKKRGIPDVHKLPSILQNISGTFICHLCYEIIFYSTHRVLHHNFFYKHIHKTHHEWVSSVAITALYSHPAEFFLSSLLPVSGGIALQGCHIATIWTWLLILLITTLTDHSGLHLPFIHSSEFHDFHHLRSNRSYLIN